MPWQTILKTLGADQGGPLERLAEALRAAIGFGRSGAADRATFTAAVVALSAKLSKADGTSVKVEKDTFERLFNVDQAEIANVRWLFDLAAQDVAGYEAYARTIAKALAERAELKQDVFEALLHIASADGIMHEGEDRFLAAVADIFGYTPGELRAFRAPFVRDPDDPYAVLGVTRDMKDDILKARYRQLMRDNHPDMIAGRGLSTELLDLAQRKVAAINAAWDEIARERGL